MQPPWLGLACRNSHLEGPALHCLTSPARKAPGRALEEPGTRPAELSEGGGAGGGAMCAKSTTLKLHRQINSTNTQLGTHTADVHTTDTQTSDIQMPHTHTPGEHTHYDSFTNTYNHTACSHAHRHICTLNMHQFISTQCLTSHTHTHTTRAGHLPCSTHSTCVPLTPRTGFGPQPCTHSWVKHLLISSWAQVQGFLGGCVQLFMVDPGTCAKVS